MPRLEMAGWIALVIIGLAAVITRFVNTEVAPPGFHVDEAAVSAHVLCLAQSGRTLDGAHWPLMTPVVGGGYSTLAYQAPAVVWTDLNGDSIGAMRGFAAMCGALSVAGIFFGALFASESRKVAILAAVSAAISPWAFQFSRIAWDPAVAPLYLSWALATLFFAVSSRAARSRWMEWAAAGASALFFAAACLCYPPLRMQVPLVLLGFVVWKRRWVRAHLPAAAAFVVVFGVCTAELWILTATGTIQGRFDDLSVFGSFYWRDHGVTSRPMMFVDGTWLLVKNFFAHFTPSYLLLSGDTNLRHSTQAFGEWSWLDAVALLVGAAVLIWRRKRPAAWMAFAAFGYVAGVLPSALTWENVPHALRSIGALPFLGMLAGGAIESVREGVARVSRFVAPATAAIALIFFGAFLPVFFVEYPQRAADAFHKGATDQLMRPEIARMLASSYEQQPQDSRDSGYPLLAQRYFELRAGAIECTPGRTRPGN